MVLIGLYLSGGPALVTRLEALGRRPWRHISQLTRSVPPADTLPRALDAGAIWGWLPCGLTCSVLPIALVSGSIARGAGLMAAFGLGTLPNSLAAGLLVTRARPWCKDVLCGDLRAVWFCAMVLQAWRTQPGSKSRCGAVFFACFDRAAKTGQPVKPAAGRVPYDFLQACRRCSRPASACFCLHCMPTLMDWTVEIDNNQAPHGGVDEKNI